MNRFTVCWHQQAEQDLARIWNESSDQSAMTLAANTIDALLSVNPNQQGTEVTEAILDPELLQYLLKRIVPIRGAGPLRVLSVQPLEVFFTIREADRQVNVWLVRGQAKP